MLKIEIAKAAEKFIRKLPPKPGKQIAQKIFALRENPHPHDSIKLKGNDGFFRADSGEYRIIYEILEDTLYILMVGHRNDDQVYRQFKRKKL